MSWLAVASVFPWGPSTLSPCSGPENTEMSRWAHGCLPPLRLLLFRWSSPVSLTSSRCTTANHWRCPSYFPHHGTFGSGQRPAQCLALCLAAAQEITEPISDAPPGWEVCRKGLCVWGLGESSETRVFPLHALQGPEALFPRGQLISMPTALSHHPPSWWGTEGQWAPRPWAEGLWGGLC